MTAIVCSKWAASEPSRVTTVQPSGRTATSPLPSVSIGSIARQMPGSELHAADARPVVRDLWLLVHLGPDSVADELANDAVAAGRATSSIAAEMSPRSPPGMAAAIPGHHRQPGRVDELAHLRGGLADDERPSPVAVPAVEDRAGIDRHDLALPDRALAGDPVDDLIVDRDAQAGRKRVAAVAVALERRNGASRADVALGEPVEMARRDTGPELGLGEREDLGNDPAGDAHLLDLATRLAGHHQRLTAGPAAGDGLDAIAAAAAARTAVLTASIGARPSTATRLPPVR